MFFVLDKFFAKLALKFNNYVIMFLGGIYMDDKELIAAKLGFLSAEEMEAYHDLCRGYFEDGTILTKDLCEKHVKGYELDKLLHMPREQRLEEKFTTILVV